MKLVRFVVLRRHADTGVKTGLLSEAYRLQDEDQIDHHVRDALSDLPNWFENNLRVPPRFSRTGSKGFHRRKTQGISWFKPTAAAHLRKMREVAVIAKSGGVMVEEVTSSNPGCVIHEVDVQVVIEPFREFKAKLRRR
jgi:hypothetical protein